MSEMAFGEFAPPAVNERARAIAHRLPHNWFGRKVASLLLGPAGGRAHRAFDVTVFGTQCVRLHPYDNISEKRVFITPQFWETEERRVLADFIRKGGGEFAFIDVGANAGLYTLFARSIAYECGRPFRAVCVEPDDTMLTRLRFNLEASGAHEEAKVFPVATGAHAGEAAFEINSDNRGESR